MANNNARLEEIEQMNRSAHDKMAEDISALECALGIPTEDLDLFFKQIPGNYMLDAGCGWGRYVSRFIEQGLDYVGIDHSAKMLAASQEKNPQQQFIQESHHQLPFDWDTFDGIWACCALGGEPKIRMPEILREYRRVLQPEGILLIIMQDTFMSKEEIVSNDPEVGPLYHSFWYSEELGQALLDAHFKIAYQTHRFECGSMTFLATK
ncbi:hypothetical protein BH11PAT2_BH11PAT2_04110 [soil metagenome]